MQIIKKSILKSMGKTICYGVLENNNNGKISYGIEISETYKNKTQNEKIENISDNKNTVIDLINYLSENVVDTAHFKDIVEDYI